VSIKNKLVTAVTTAGLLAGLFGSAFVPAARADVGDSVAFECDTAASTSTCVQQVDGRITLTTDPPSTQRQLQTMTLQLVKLSTLR